MSHNILNILYNPASLQSCDTTATHFDNSDADHEVQDQKAMSELELLVQAGTKLEVMQALVRLKETLRHPVSLKMRAGFLKEFVLFLARAATEFSTSKLHFQESFQVLLQFKALIDQKSQSQGLISQSEWVLLERALYELSRWEETMAPSDQIGFYDA